MLLRRAGWSLLVLAGALGCGAEGGDDASATGPSVTGAGGSGGSGSSATAGSVSTASGGGAGGAGAGGAGSGASSSVSTGGGGAGGVEGAWCGTIPACDAPPPDPGTESDWNQWDSPIIVATGSPNHRGRDLVLN